jgi:M6 family metalloprotease-like protein
MLALFFLLLLNVVVSTAPLLETQAEVAIDDKHYYRLINRKAGAHKSLQSQKDGKVKMVDTERHDLSQKWYFNSSNWRSGGKWYIRNALRGDGYILGALGTSGDKRNDIRMEDAGKVGPDRGAYWNVTWSTDGTATLKNDLTGPNKCLTVPTTVPDNPRLDLCITEGSQWEFTKLEQIIPVESSVPDLTPTTPNPPNEGKTEYPHFAKPHGIVRIHLVFGRFQDNPEEKSSEINEIKDFLTNRALLEFWRHESQDARVILDISAESKYKTVVRKFKDKELDRDAFIQDVLNSFKPNEKIDFTTFDAIWVAPQPKSNITRAETDHTPTKSEYAGTALRTISFGEDDYYALGWKIAAHEMGHVFGLPDLYPGGKKDGGDREVFEAGAWDMMSDDLIAGNFLNWHRHKLGWIDAKRTEYIKYGWSGTTTKTLTPYYHGVGLTMLVIALNGPHDQNKVLVLEVAEPIPGTENDPHVKANGVLTYTVDSNVTKRDCPIKIKAKSDAYSEKFGNKYLAPWSENDRYFHDSEGLGPSVYFKIVEQFYDSWVVEVTVTHINEPGGHAGTNFPFDIDPNTEIINGLVDQSKAHVE